MLMVIFIHIAAPGFYAFTEPHWWAVNIYESVSRVSVPLFFMVTGALLLPREQTVKSILYRVYRVALPLIIWSVIYLIWFQYIGEKKDSWLLRILNGPVVAHLWYIYTLIGAYLFLPVMSGFFNVKNLNVKLFTLLFWFIGTSVNTTVVNLTHNLYLGISWDFLSLYAGYMVFGAIIYHNVKLTKRIFSVGLLTYITSAILIAFLTWSYSLYVQKPHEMFYVYHSPLVVLGAIGIFAALIFIGQSFITERCVVYKFLIFQGKASFGIYLVHILVVMIFNRFGVSFMFINPWFGIPVMVVMIFLISLVIVRLIQGVPVLRMIVPS